MTGARPSDDRAVSEGMGVAILVGFTILVTASVGVGVLVIGNEPPDETEGEFAFDHIQDSSSLVVTYDRGQPLQAGNVLVVGPDTEVTWAEVADNDPESDIEPGDTILLSSGSEYGETITSSDRIQVVYAPSEGNQTVLSGWTG